MERSMDTTLTTHFGDTMHRRAITLAEILVVTMILALFALIAVPLITEKQGDPRLRVDVEVGWIVDIPNRGWYRIHSIQNNGVTVSLVNSSAKADDYTTLIPLSWKEIRAPGVKIMKMGNPESPSPPP